MADLTMRRTLRRSSSFARMASVRSFWIFSAGVMGMHIAEEEEKNLTESSQRTQRRARGSKMRRIIRSATTWRGLGLGGLGSGAGGVLGGLDVRGFGGDPSRAGIAGRA